MFVFFIPMGIFVGYAIYNDAEGHTWANDAETGKPIASIKRNWSQATKLAASN